MAEQSKSTRPAPPDLVWRYPDCGLCGDEVEGDGDSFSCRNCEATWSGQGTHGEWSDQGAQQCLAEWGYRELDVRDRCVLHAGHGTDHLAVDGSHWDEARETSLRIPITRTVERESAS